MIIVNNKKFYAKDIKAAKYIESANGWDRSAASQWYSLYWDENTNLVILGAETDNLRGDGTTRYFDSPKAFAAYYDGCGNKLWSDIFTDDEDEEDVVDRFVSQILG